MKIIARLLFPFLLMFAQPCFAIREGTANANIFIKSYEQRGEEGKLALWHEAAAECLTRISVPMNELAHNYYTQHGFEKWAARAQKEAQEIQAQRDSHLKRAKAAWAKLKSVAQVLCPSSHPSALKTEREKIAKFMTTWLPHYPDRFYEFGIYPTFFREQRELAEQKGDYVRALQLEADAAEMCAAQYQKIPIAFGLRSYEKRRDAYLRHAASLRTLAQQNKDSRVEGWKDLVGRREGGKAGRREVPPIFQCSNLPILHIAKSDVRVKTALADQKGVHEYAWFQGFAWTVRFSNHSRGTLATAIIDDKTGKALDVLNSK